ncbi:MAG: creatininase family protein [Hyphomicrobiaceae bacterium]
MRIYAHLNQSDIAELAPDTVAVLPLGSIENHGLHLPLGTDTIIAEAILDRTDNHLGNAKTHSVRLPPLWLGSSVEHSERPGTLTTPATRFVAQILDIAESLSRNNIRRLILLSAHGGNNSPARIAAIEARARHKMLCATPHWLDFGLPDDFEPPTPVGQDAHGGWMETSMMLAAAPDLVSKDRPAARKTGAPAAMLYPDGPISWGWMTDDLGKDGVIGDASHATPERGKALLDHAAKSLAALITQIATADWPPAD